MPEISRSVLFGKLNPIVYKSLENAYTFSRLRENSYVELVHWLHALMQTEQTDVFGLIRHFGIDEAKVRRDILAAADKLPNGATSVADFSEHIQTLVEQAWTFTSLKFNANCIRSAYLFFTLLKNNHLYNILIQISPEWLKLKADKLVENMATITRNSTENVPTNMTENVNYESTTGKSALVQYGSNLTEKAKNGEIDPITGRDAEIRQIIDILMRRRQNNPILTGEAGVGKSAVVEAFALRLATGDVPPSLQGVQLITLDIGLLKAGAGISGEFESRLRAVMDEVESSTIPIILFIDEIHTLIGAGGAAGTGDAANLLKPALARGQLRTIGATTWAEYKKYFEKDPALTRRFQMVQIEEPDETEAVNMLRTLAPSLEKHHQVVILDQAIQAAVKLSHRYIPARQLPDKAVGLIDTACARVAVSQHTTPGEIEFLQKQITALELEQSNLMREAKLYLDSAERLDAISLELESLHNRLEERTAQWREQADTVAELLEVRRIIMEDSIRNLSSEYSQELQSRQKNLLNQLNTFQAAGALVHPLVDEPAVADVVAEWTGIPVGTMLKDELEAVLKLADTLNKRIIGQRHGLEAIARRIQTSRAGLDDPNKPIGVFMLAGPSGVGKTETALALADALYGGEQHLITINMSEYQEAHTVSTLKGAPPGYVGYGEGGILTEAVRRKPYSVVLLDEIEKAHPDVHEIFFQVFDKGWMEDGEGRYIDFKNTVIILTTNVGSDLVMNLCEDPELMPTPDGMTQALREPLLKVFPAALLGRIQTIPYYPLSDDILSQIVVLQLNRIVERMMRNQGIALNYTPAVLQLIISRCTEIESGGRMIDAILTNTILPEISRKLIGSIVQENKITTVTVDVENNDFIYYYS